MIDLDKIEQDAVQRTRKAKTQQALVELRAEILGKKGSLGLALKNLGELPAAERPQAGKQINIIKQKIEQTFEKAEQRLLAAEQKKELEAGRCDVTLPGRRTAFGLPHPLRLVEEEIIRALIPLGFTVAEGPIVEHDWYNFAALNFPPDHPARDTQDTLFVTEQVLLRTHTSNVQIRTMTKQGPPVRILAPGMVFRHDEIDATHSPTFHQIEGLWVDEKATFADMKGVLRRFACHVFGPQTRIRFRPSFFPFTEPSAEVDVTCVVCHGQGGECRVCKGTGWVEILGAGMVDPEVFTAVGYDPDVVQGFAFGVGVERVAMLRYGVDDMRLFFENDLRFLRQFSRAPLAVV